MFAWVQQPKTKRRLHRAWLRFAAVAIGCQFLVPTGYMPGSLADGTPFVFCRMFAPAAAQQEHPDDPRGDTRHTMHAGMPAMAAHAADMAGHDAPEHDEHLGAQAWENCPLGALSSAAALAFAAPSPVLPPGADSIATVPAALLRSVPVRSAQARAPPITAIPRSI